jgi:hypothetical protein
VECALKACIAKKTKKYEFPDKELVNASYTHKLSRLIEIAGLSTLLDAQSKMDKQFEVNWSTVKNWNENSRYMSPSKQEADDIYKAIANKKHGVISWIRQHW